MNKKICGKYKHYKSKEYIVYSLSLDEYGNEFVLYKQNYGEGTFWVRPFEDFVSEVEIIDEEHKETKRVKRFELVEEAKSYDFLNDLITLIKEKDIIIKHTDKEHITYVITNVSINDERVIVQSLNNNCGYLTDYDIIRRMNKNCCVINGKLEIWDIRNKQIDKFKKLVIDNYDNNKISEHINPCSIDLEIAESDFWNTRKKVIDLESIIHTLSAHKWWKKIKCKVSAKSKNKYFKLKPGNTVVTHLNSKIIIPKDCAGKIEIKSAYARLSLSISSSDFCNPGYEGYFPLEITNHGKSTIVIYGNQVMAQLMLIPLASPILTSYVSKATQKNNDNIDEGVPYYFWKERSIKKVCSGTGGEIAIRFYEELKKVINKNNVNDINAYKSRFEKKFFVFYEKIIYNEKIDNFNDIIYRLKETIEQFSKKEKFKKRIYDIIEKIKIGSIVLCLFAFIGFLIRSDDEKIVEILPYFNKKYFANISGIFFIIFILLEIILFFIKIFCRVEYCTFEKIDVDKIFESILNNKK